MKLSKEKLRSYTILLILDSNQSYEQFKKVSLKYAKFVKRHNAKNIELHFFGKRHLNYKIKNNSVADFLQLQFETSPAFISAFKDEIKFDGVISRVMITKN
uniref:Ribosomal protein S6 n=1 Tax=Olisthodiscus luteus TaxID=83000 RepID=A0A7U0KSL5_OLILU|nr:ribosomal protein S6 [Olisthodiscus luteus]YP_010152827.1 ribosomal protein S6 [Olisthodiscus luteus]QQW50464.1 ribosomal protein S6 [Olisthodiscus luteus]QQW50488.1 ribosomal protein S6 [Olisthodiscus luteus]